MRGLEVRLGVRLLNRTTRSVSPTEAGLELLGRLQVTASLDDALDAVAPFRGTVAGTVRINAPRLAAAVLVRDALPRMVERFPDVTVDVVVEGRLIDIVSGGFDAGVRQIGSIPKDMIAVTLAGPLGFVCVASPAYLLASANLKPRTTCSVTAASVTACPAASCTDGSSRWPAGN